uniref:7TM_GPCR_Srx domain-containing protein n=1 Tax=Caenorhabditis tropicalis TaxID=1561998 RepID=A0A1I7TMB5_9PELO
MNSDERQKCMGTMRDLKSSLSSSVMTIIKVFIWERSLGSNIVPICISILSLGILLDLAVQGLFHCRLNHRQETSKGVRYIYFHNVGNKFFISFFVFAIFLGLALLTEQYFWKPDRHRNSN